METANLQQLLAIEFEDNTDVTMFLKRGRDLARQLSEGVSFTAAELEAILAEVGDGHVLAMGIDRKLRARAVAGHVQRAAEAFSEGGICLVRAGASFRKHYAPELAIANANSKPTKPRLSFVAES